jgi:hypothetical protein
VCAAHPISSLSTPHYHIQTIELQDVHISKWLNIRLFARMVRAGIETLLPAGRIRYNSYLLK